MNARDGAVDSELGIARADIGFWCSGRTAGQILQTFDQVGLGLDVRCGGHQFFRLGDRVAERPRKPA
jgi:hypothetical protein